ncbi:MAG: VOC family protein [Alphaproteobacteria bacterium]
MTKSVQTGKPPAMPAVRGVHHFAYKCRNGEETRRFYEDVLGLPLVHVIEEQNVKTTTGDTVSFAHFFFRMADGNYLAFFDLGDETITAKDPNTPQFANHLALGVDGEEELMACKARLEAAGIPVVGPMDHDAFVRSIYFWDPNGVRLEFTYTIADRAFIDAHEKSAHAALRKWVNESSPAARKRLPPNAAE